MPAGAGRGPPRTRPAPAEVVTLPGTLGGSAANLQVPSVVTKPRSTKLVGLLAGTAVLALVGVVALAVLRPNEESRGAATDGTNVAVDPPATAAAVDRTTTGEQDPAPPPSASAATPAGTTAASNLPGPAASIAGTAPGPTQVVPPPPRPTRPAGPSGPPPPRGSADVVREDHGF